MGGQPLILFDTHALIWLDQDHPALGPNANRLADEALASGALAVSAVTLWEAAMLERKGRLDLGVPLVRWRRDLIRRGLVELPMTGAIGIAAAGLDAFHADPADRLIVATALEHRATLVTADRQILEWPGELMRHEARL